MFKNILNNFLKTIVSFNLIVLPAFSSPTTGPETDERTLEKIDTFLNAGNPSDIPFIDYMDSFIIDSTQPLKRFDLSAFEGKRIFLGYGVYDKDQNFCKYVEKPGMPDPKIYLQNISTFNKHTYGLSLTTMNYDACVNLANRFNGTPAVITSAAENGYLSGKYGSLSKWIGIERASCVDEYKNKDGLKQEYFNWSSLSESNGVCSNSKLNVIQNQFGTWNKKDKLELNHCLIEVDTEEITRPIKICAPWWRIEREYQKEAETMFGGIDVYKINQADIPEQFNVCTKYEESAITAVADAPNRKVTCTSYYDSVIAPECLKNPIQAICHIDECNGYIKNACRIVDTLSGFKDYTKAETIISGTNTITKGKVDIKTHVYECPPSLPSLQSCEEQSTVIIFPKECPGSDCEGYRNCIQNSTTIDEKNDCATNFVCEKIYGNPDSASDVSDPKIYDSTGKLIGLKNTCSDGTPLYFELSTQSKSTKKCLEYEYYTIEEEVSQKCTLDRSYTTHTVDTSITEVDTYMNNPNCIRMNNILDARPTVEVKFDYKNNGWAQTVLKKSYLDGEENVDLQAGSDIITVDAAMNPSDPFDASGITPPSSTEPARGTDCSIYGETWETRNNKILNNYIVMNAGLATEKKFLAESIASDNGTTLYAKYSNINSTTECDYIKTKLAGTSTNYSTTTKICKVYIPKLSGDKFSLIKGVGSLTTGPSETVSTFNNVLSEENCLSLQVSNGGDSYGYDSATKVCEVFKSDPSVLATYYEDYTYITQTAINKSSCDDIAYCLYGKYNESAYLSSALSQCQVTSGENNDYEEPATIDALSSSTGNTNMDENCRPVPKTGSYLSQLDGTQDIFSVQEVVTGDFGYFSNYNSHPFINNVVSINEKEVYPLKPIPILDDPLIYEGNFTQTSITTKKPNIVAGSIGGAAAGGATYALSSYAPALMTNPVGWIILAVVVVFVIVAMIFGKKQKFNEQKYKWIIYKLVPQERYIYNVYGYDHRILKLNADGTVYVNPQNKLKLIYAELEGFTGTLKPNNFKVMLKNLYVTKETLLTCMGWFKTDVANITHPVEKGVIVSYPECKRLSWSCNKKKRKDFSLNRDPFFKRMTNNYIGAINGMSIIVPYLGDYELTAYDQFDNLLGNIIIYENEFIDSTSSVAKYAQVMFGLNMDLAEGINEGTTNNACRYDLMTEWGGGVSGIYYENNDTGLNVDCQKSHDNYVKLNSATKIKIKSLATDRPHVIDLVKPLPFPNRVFLVTLNEKELREYRCYIPFGDCNNDNYRTTNN